MNKHLTTKSNRDVSPWSALQSDLWDLFDRFSEDFNVPSLGFGGQEFSPKIEVKDTGKTYQVLAEVPGMDEKDINVTLRDNQLIIEGEKKNEQKSEDKKKGLFHSEFSYGQFYRAIPLSDDIDSEKVNASYKNGVLTIDLEKLPEKQSKNKRIQISSGKSDAKQIDTKH
jgi:HSP20 family protein